MRFQKGSRYMRSEVGALPTTPIILCIVVSVSRSYVTQLFEVDIDFKNVFTLKIIWNANFTEFEEKPPTAETAAVAQQFLPWALLGEGFP